ncbi:unnamed protein product, partial [Anisakis simplex]|uniref:Myosin_tail_1 domain-containing protein n=1 Tax=Anisakis simplex TaxID=6269 RepID=A0A0M3KKB6_ANISI
MNETKRNDASGSESSAIKVEALETEKRQMESTLRSMERQCELIEENAKLRDGLAIAIAKAERFKEDLEIVKDANSALNEDLKKARDDKSNAIVRAETLQQAIGEKERLVAYLQ